MGILTTAAKAAAKVAKAKKKAARIAAANKPKAPINNKMEGGRKPKGYIPDPLEIKLIDQIKRHPIKFNSDFGWGTGTETLKAIKGSLDVKLREQKNAGKKSATTKKPSAVSSSRRSTTKTMALYKVQDEIRDLANRANMSVKAWRRKNSNNALVKKLYSIKPSIKEKDANPVRSIKKGPPISRERIPGVKRNKKGRIIDRDGT